MEVIYFGFSFINEYTHARALAHRHTFHSTTIVALHTPLQVLLILNVETEILNVAGDLLSYCIVFFLLLCAISVEVQGTLLFPPLEHFLDTNAFLKVGGNHTPRPVAADNSSTAI